MHRMLKLKIDVVDDFAVHFHRTLSNQAPGFAGRFGELEHVDYESANPDRLGRGKPLVNFRRRYLFLESCFEIISRRVRCGRTMKARHQLRRKYFFYIHWVTRSAIHLRS